MVHGRTMTSATELFQRYHRRIRQLTSRRPTQDAWQADVQQIVRSLDDECRELSPRSGVLLRQELSNQVEHELLRCTDPDAKAVLNVVLKHLDAV